MNVLFFAAMTLTGTCAAGLAGLWLLSLGGRTTIVRAKQVLNAAPRPGNSTGGRAGLARKLLALVGRVRGTVGLSIEPKLAERFEQAGITSPSHWDVFLVGRVLLPLLAVFAASFSPWSRPLFLLGMPAAAYLAPDILLTRLVARRRKQIQLGIPDVIDLLVICVDAGLGLDQAMLRVAMELQKRHPALQQELLRISREQRAGKQRLDAWESMSRRNQLPELDGFVNMLQQTERFGTPIARALSEFGDGIRQKRRQRAEELAAKTTVKIIFPLVLCIFPSLFIVLLGPPGINMAQGLPFQ